MSQKEMKKINKYSFSHPSGSKTYPKRELKTDSTGVTYIGYVVNTKGENMMDDWYEKIQKPKDSTNVRLLLERAVQSDNTAILNQREKVSADLSGLPDNLLDVMNQFQGVKNYFDNLPVEVKKDFGNNPYEFIKRQGKFSDELVKYYDTLKKTPVESIFNEEKKVEKKDGDK